MAECKWQSADRWQVLDKSYQGPRELMGGTKKVNKDFLSEFWHVTAIRAIGFFRIFTISRNLGSLSVDILLSMFNVQYSVCTSGAFRLTPCHGPDQIFQERWHCLYWIESKDPGRNLIYLSSSSRQGALLDSQSHSSIPIP